jgi:hypothetical protein
VKKSRFSEEQFIAVLKEQQWIPVAELCRKHGMSNARKPFSRWRIATCPAIQRVRRKRGIAEL